MTIAVAGCKGGNENTDLPPGLVFEDFLNQIADSALYPLWAYGSASRTMPDDADGLRGALDGDTVTAWLTEPGCGEGAFFTLVFDDLAAAAVYVEVGQHLWLAVPDSFAVRWNEEPWQTFRDAGTVRGSPPLRKLTIRLGHIPHVNFYRLPVIQDSAQAVAITDKKTGFLYNSRPSGIRRLQFLDAQGRPLPVSWPKSQGFQIRRSDGKRLPWLTEAWGDVFADTPLPPWPDSAGTTFVVSFERTLTIRALRLMGFRSGDSAGEIRFGLAGGIQQSISPISRSREVIDYPLPRPLRGRQFLLSFSAYSTPAHLTFITDAGPVWPKPANLGAFAEAEEKKHVKQVWPPGLGPFINLPIFYQESRSHFHQPLRSAFRKEAKAHDTLPWKTQHIRQSLLILEDGRLYLNLRETEVTDGQGFTSYDKSYYGRWYPLSWTDGKIILHVAWLDMTSSPAGLPRSEIQTSSLTIDHYEIRCAHPSVVFPLPVHFRSGL